MTTNFALSLSFEGINLLHRVQRGWRLVGKADVEDPGLAAALRGMRDKAMAIEPEGLRTKIVIPMDQIKYLAIDSTQTTLDDIHATLNGATPYALNELLIDYERSGGRTHIAAVARETLQEAEAFAHAHGFNPVCFVAVPEPFTFQKEVFFGPTAIMRDILGPDGQVARDPLPVLVVGTRIKSRLLVFNNPDLNAHDDVDENVDDATPVECEVDDATKTVAEDSTAAVVETAPRIDRVIGEYHPVVPVVAPAEPEVQPETAAPESVETVEMTQEAETPAAPPQVWPLSEVYLDPIIAEYHASKPKTAPKPVTIAAPAAKVAAPKVAARPMPAVANTDRRPFLISAGLAAAVVMTAGVLWWQLGADATEATATPMATAPVADAEPILAAVAEPEIASELPEPEVVAEATTAPALSETPPDITLLEIAPPSLPLVPTNSAMTPGIYAAPVEHVVPVLSAAPEQDAPITELEGPAVAPIPESEIDDSEVVAAEPGAPILRGRVLSPDEAAEIYAATGVWQRAPRIPSLPRAQAVGTVTLPEANEPHAPVAQPSPLDPANGEPDLSFLAPAVPPAPEVTFPIDDNGFILATPEGTLTPEGAVVYAGLPDLRVRARPELSEEELERMAALTAAPEGVVVVPGTPAVQPPLRPDDLAPTEASSTETAEAEEAATEEETEVAAVQPAVRPSLRPEGAELPSEPVELPSNPDITSVIAGVTAEEEANAFANATANAVDQSRRPETRPRNFERVVAIARSRQQPEPTPTPPASDPDEEQAPFEVTLPQTTAPVPGGVARAATQDDVLPMRDMNLIGVYGKANQRRALVRLSNGRYVRVEVGSALDGGQVTAIGDSALNYVKRGRTYALELPAG